VRFLKPQAASSFSFMYRASARLEKRQRGWVNRAAVSEAGGSRREREEGIWSGPLCLLTRPGTLHWAAELPPSEEIGRASLPVTAALGSLVGRR